MHQPPSGQSADGLQPPSTIMDLFAFLGSSLSDVELHSAMHELLSVVRPGEDPVRKLSEHARALLASGQPVPPILDKTTRLLEQSAWEGKHSGASSGYMGSSSCGEGPRAALPRVAVPGSNSPELRQRRSIRAESSQGPPRPA